MKNNMHEFSRLILPDKGKLGALICVQVRDKI